MTPETSKTHDAFAQLCRDLAAEQRHARPEKSPRLLPPAPAETIRELVDAITPPERRAR